MLKADGSQLSRDVMWHQNNKKLNW